MPDRCLLFCRFLFHHIVNRSNTYQSSLNEAGFLPSLWFCVHSVIGNMSPSDSLPAEQQFHRLAYMLSSYGFPCRGGSLQFRTVLSIHAVSFTPEDSSTSLPKFFTSSIVFTQLRKAQLPLCFSFAEILLDDAAEFT